MNVFLWDSYEEGEINDKIKYWVDLWEDLIENFNNDSYGLNLVNPHLILMDIIDEIKFNRLKNSKNKEYFLKTLGVMLKSDPVIKNSFKSDFTLIIKELQSNRLEYFLQLCEDIVKLFQEGLYFNKSFDELKKILLNSKMEKEDEKNISIISQNLIVEFTLIGYSLDEIKKFPSYIFDKYDIIEGGEGELLSTKFPIKIKSEDFKEGDDFNLINYNEAFKTEINSLTTLV